MEPRTSYMQSMRSTTELHPHVMRVFSAFVDLKVMKVIEQCLEMLGIEPRTSYMQSMRSTTELHPHLMRVFSAFVDLKTL